MPPAADRFGRREPRLLQRVRRWITAQVRRAAVSTAPRLSPGAIERLGQIVARGGPYAPIVARQIAGNMRAAGVYSPAVLREHFRRLGEHFAGALYVQRCAADDPDRRGTPAADEATAGRTAEHRAAFEALIEQRFTLGESLGPLRNAAAAGRGVIVVCPHMTDFLLNVARLNRILPVTAYLRHGKDPVRQEAKQRWYRASGVEWISEPADVGGPLGRIGLMTTALSRGRALFITPDLPQKRDTGVAVAFCGREVYLPGGAALLALRSGAPLFLLTAERDGQRQRLVASRAYEPPAALRGREHRRAVMQDIMQWFARGFESFVRTQPALWYLWGDKRWTRVFRGDPRYAGPLPADGKAPQ